MSLTVILALALITAVLALVLKQQKPELALAVSAAGGCVIFFTILKSLVAYVNELGGFFIKAGIDNGYFVLILKALGICYLTQFVSDLCRDYGQTSLAGRVDLAGKCCVLALSFPLMERLIDVAVRYIE
ncbi:MAG: hypothetical protein J6I80_04915 [Clostridia bacterium]|nr:hypothetical protein [Clostridia bacterium]